MQDTWTNLGGNNPHDTVSKLRKQLQSESVYQLQWLNHIKGFGKDNQHKLRTYCKFKTKFELEPYLTGSIPVRKRQNLSKLRISAHTLAIETGRYTQPKTPLEQRKCSLCKGWFNIFIIFTRVQTVR